MRKLFLFASLCLLTTAVTFFSCDEIDEVLGSMDITIDGEKAHIPSAYFQFTEGQTTITSVGVGHNIAITFAGQTAENYVLGFGKDPMEAATGAISEGFSTPTNALVYKKTLETSTNDLLISVFGKLEVKEVSKTAMKGSFEVTVANFETLRDLDAQAIVRAITGADSKKITGTFSAISLTNK